MSTTENTESTEKDQRILDGEGRELLAWDWQVGPLDGGRNGVTLVEWLDAAIGHLQRVNERIQPVNLSCREYSVAITALEEARNRLVQRAHMHPAPTGKGTQVCRNYSY